MLRQEVCALCAARSQARDAGSAPPPESPATGTPAAPAPPSPSRAEAPRPPSPQGSGSLPLPPPYARHRATLIVVLAVIGLFPLLGFLGPIAWVMADRDLARMSAGRMNAGGRAATETGRVVAMVASGMFAFVVAFCLVVLFGVGGVVRHVLETLGAAAGGSY